MRKSNTIPKDAEVGTEIEPAVPALHNCGGCGGKATGAYKDHHGLWRCSCAECGYWDDVVSTSPEEAEVKWQASRARSFA